MATIREFDNQVYYVTTPIISFTSSTYFVQKKNSTYLLYEKHYLYHYLVSLPVTYWMPVRYQATPYFSLHNNECCCNIRQLGCGSKRNKGFLSKEKISDILNWREDVVTKCSEE
ncbi:3245_t:CDS:2 [Ambispora gerdemannii]|uniref:3245_t:CDS:1 n=1 Tax=Ambispora gerdemannii TaxID=144530 RepID=A0A9N9GRK8_9GLOM|nr:3245_t:CDS:2 [Ambispora gerdemannii]